MRVLIESVLNQVTNLGNSAISIMLNFLIYELEMPSVYLYLYFQQILIVLSINIILLLITSLHMFDIYMNGIVF